MEPLLTAHRVLDTKRSNSSGLESTVDFWATVLLLLGIITSFFIVLIGIFAGARPFWFVLLLATFAALSMAVVWVVLRGLAEIIRLLKKIAGLQYSGEITGTEMSHQFYACSNCGQMLHSETTCDTCGAKIVPDQEPTT
jgi:hypothetical protein